MKKSAFQLEQLARLAQIRSDIELKRFAAFRAHVDSIATQRLNMREKLNAVYAQETSFSIAEARLANHEAGRFADGIARLDAELGRLRPGFNAARHRAVREFGRVQVLNSLIQDIHDDDTKKKLNLE